MPGPTDKGHGTHSPRLDGADADDELPSARRGRTNAHDLETPPGSLTANQPEEKPSPAIRLKNPREEIPFAGMDRTSSEEVATLGSGVKVERN
jgi:hypothetical protein